jgi:hypothetical protein
MDTWRQLEMNAL